MAEDEASINDKIREEEEAKQEALDLTEAKKRAEERKKRAYAALKRAERVAKKEAAIFAKK